MYDKRHTYIVELDFAAVPLGSNEMMQEWDRSPFRDSCVHCGYARCRFPCVSAVWFL